MIIAFISKGQRNTLLIMQNSVSPVYRHKYKMNILVPEKHNNNMFVCNYKG